MVAILSVPGIIVQPARGVIIFDAGAAIP